MKLSGHVLTFTLLVLSILLILTTIALQLVNREQYSAFQSLRTKQAISLAEAGLEHAVRQLNSNSNYPGEADTALGDGTFTITVTGSGNSRLVEATGFIPSSINPRSSRTIRAEATLNAETVEFFYGVQVDGGGIQMSNNSRVNGNVYSNGNILGSNGATITGDVTVAGGLSDSPTVAWETHNADQFFATASNNRDIAQSFSATQNAALNKVGLYLAKVGNPTSNLTLRVHSDNGNKPATSSLASTVIPYASIGLSPSWIDATFSSPPNLTNGNRYWLVLDYGSNSSSNYWNWRKDTGNGYANNTGKYTSNCCSGNPTWTDVGGDLAFKVWLGGTVTRIQDVTIGNSTSGTGYANQFVNANIHGSSCPNQYCVVANPPPSVMPISDGNIQDWKNDAAAGGTLNGYTLTNGGVASLGPKKINGDFTIDNNAQLTLTGTVWVTGTITLSNNAQVKLDAGYGTNSGILLGDNVINISNNATFLGAGSGSYVLLLATRDAKGSVSINVSNNSNGVIYYAGKSRISFSNNATAKEATAWGIDLSNGATITYDSGLANASFTSGPGGGWSVKRGTWREILN